MGHRDIVPDNFHSPEAQIEQADRFFREGIPSWPGAVEAVARGIDDGKFHVDQLSPGLRHIVEKLHPETMVQPDHIGLRA